MTRRLAKLSPFPFERDFQPARATAPETVSMTPADLAALLAETRDSAAALVRDETLALQGAHLAQVSEDLQIALRSLVDLVRHLEIATIDEVDRQTALANVRKIASTLLEGQGDLFQSTAKSSRVGNHSG